MLNAVLALLADPARYAPTGLARTATGRRCAATSPRAVAWSLGGACVRVMLEQGVPWAAANAAYLRVRRVEGRPWVEVVGVLEREASQ
jgi:hypothetical protein